jgi:DNA-binding NarL/FixJ family response regulator
LVLLDRQLPDARGSAVLESIRKLDPKAKVIVLTGYADADGERKYRALGVKRFLSKGMGLSALLDIIGAQLAAPSA